MHREISIIIPVYNGEAFIKKAYEFILSQKIIDIEIIYVDNNSKDNSIEEVKKLQVLDNRVMLFQQQIQGASAARNMGLENAKGKYIYMFDVDDQVYPEAIKSMKMVLDEYPLMEAVFGKMIKSHFDINETVKPNDETNEIVFKDKPYWGIKWFSDLKTVVGPPAFLYRKEVFDKIGVYELPLLTGQDTALDIKLGMLCNVAFIDKYIYLYFKHGSSTTDLVKKKTDSAFMQWPRYTKSHLAFYLNHPVPEEFKKELFKRIYIHFGKMLYLTDGIKNRKALKEQLLVDIEKVKTPWHLKRYLDILVRFNSSYVYKFYIYYFVPKLLPYIIKINDGQFKKL